MIAPPNDNKKGRDTGEGPVSIRSIIWGVIIVLTIASIGIGFILNRKNGGSCDDNTSKDRLSPIPVHESAGNPQSQIAATVTQPERRKYKDLTNSEKLQYYRDKYGDDIPDNLKPIVYYLENEPKQHFRAKSDKTAIFRHHSEREIASFLMVEPGTRMVRPVVFNERFDKDLAIALSEPIEITAEDSEEQRRLKEAVVEVKNELYERAKAGENPSQIMTDAAKELYLLGQYRDDLDAEVRAIKNDPTKSDDDLTLAVEAANKMLKKKGLKPLRQPNMLIRRANLKKAQKKAKGTQK